MSPWWLLFVALQSGLLLVLFMVNLCQCDAWVSMVLRACVPARTFPRWRSRTIRETSMNRALIDPRALHIDVSSTSESVLTDDASADVNRSNAVTSSFWPLVNGRARRRFTRKLSAAQRRRRRWRTVKLLIGGTLILLSLSLLVAVSEVCLRDVSQRALAAASPPLMPPSMPPPPSLPLIPQPSTLNSMDGCLVREALPWAAAPIGRLLLPPGVAVALICVLPCDVCTIHFLCLIGAISGLAIAGISTAAVIGIHLVVAPSPEDDARLILYATLSAYVSIFLGYAICQHSLSPRQRLLRLWLALRIVGLTVALESFVYGVVKLAAQDVRWELTVESSRYLVGNVLFAFVLILTCACTAPSIRNRLTRPVAWGFLLDSAIDSSPDQQTAAAAIAALIGNYDPRVAFETARRRFRAIRVSDLDEAFWQVSDLAAPPAGTYSTEAVELGVDPVAFVSHSWRDENNHPGVKHTLLHAWATRHQAAFHRQPLVWLDRVCIDQNNIERDLMCLPIFLAGSSNLVVIFGRTYPTRLWCALELFVFLHVSNTPEAVTVLPLEDSAAVVEACAQFDASRAKCFKHSDKERLLAIIEAGFGQVGEFNAQVRRMFALRVAVDIAP